MSFCPACGQPVGLNGPRLLDLLVNGRPHRSVYRSQSGDWIVDYRGGKADPRAVQELVDAGKIQSRYDSHPDEIYHVGKTVDCEKSREARRSQGIGALLVYVEEPPTTSK